MKNYDGNIIGKMIRRFIDHDVAGAGAQMAYYLLLLIFPLLIFVIAILGFLNLPVDDALYFLSLIVPRETLAFLERFIEYIFTEKHANLLLVSLVTTFWTASNALRVLANALNRAYEVEESRGYIKRKLLAIPFTLLVTLCISTALFIPILGKGLLLWLAHFIQISNILIQYLKYLRWIMAIFTLFSVLLAMYYISPNVKIRVANIIPGAALGTAAWIIMSSLFSLYFSIFNGYAIIYGSIGAFIVLMVWLLWSSMVIIIGGELNAVLEDIRYTRHKKRRSISKENKELEV